MFCFTDGGIQCRADLHWYWSYRYGNCFQFNVGLNSTNNKIEKRMTSKVGSDNGSFPVINFRNENTTDFGLPLGMIVFVHNSLFRPRSEDGIFIKPGELTNIGVKRVFVKNTLSPLKKENKV